MKFSKTWLNVAQDRRGISLMPFSNVGRLIFVLIEPSTVLAWTRSFANNQQRARVARIPTSSVVSLLWETEIHDIFGCRIYSLRCKSGNKRISNVRRSLLTDLLSSLASRAAGIRKRFPNQKRKKLKTTIRPSPGFLMSDIDTTLLANQEIPALPLHQNGRDCIS